MPERIVERSRRPARIGGAPGERRAATSAASPPPRAATGAGRWRAATDAAIALLAIAVLATSCRPLRPDATRTSELARSTPSEDGPARAPSGGRATLDPTALGTRPAVNVLPPTATPTRSPTPPTGPDAPPWPVPELVTSIRSLLVRYYDQEDAPSAPYYERAPEYEADKAVSRKDPDTLWEFHGGPGTACHPAATDAAFAECTGRRLARTFDMPYGGPTLFDASRGYYANEAIARIAGHYALYHVFAHDFDAPRSGDYVPTRGRAPRDYRLYHERMVRAYEGHMRRVLVALLTEARGDAQFQIDVTRGVGGLVAGYVRVLRAMERDALWASPADRRNALALLSGLTQRVWWEWAWALSEGPPTAGFADLGSEATYLAAARSDPRWAGMDGFVYDGRRRPSLRPSALDVGVQAGLWFDADYTVPGEWFCYARFGGGTVDLQRCLAQARRESRGGDLSPFGQYFGVEGGPAPCDRRSAGRTSAWCGETNLGSIAEEWLWSFVGLRAGASVLSELAAGGDPDLPEGAPGATVLAAASARMGYGVSGFYGADGRFDDMEWLWSPSGTVRAVRTLSAARHDFAPQDGRLSVGEDASSAASSGRRGDTWASDGQEFPGGVENHAPGPSALYGSSLFATILDDRAAGGMATSLYDAAHRNHVDEFDAWLWLYLGAFHRCPGVTDPADGRCLAYAPDRWPWPGEIRRVALYTRPDDATVDLRFRYLWLDRHLAVDASHEASPDTTCRGQAGLPWRKVYDRAASADGGYLVDEGGYGAYNARIQAAGGLMRLVAARYRQAAPSPADVVPYDLRRRDLLAPWYEDARREIGAILRLFRDPSAGYGYVPEIENSTCVGFDPGDPGRKMVLSWQQGTGDSVQATTIRRALWYAVAAVWYAWYDTDWLAEGASARRPTNGSSSAPVVRR